MTSSKALPSQTILEVVPSDFGTLKIFAVMQLSFAHSAMVPELMTLSRSSLGNCDDVVMRSCLFIGGLM